jgi:hypothetical protein
MEDIVTDVRIHLINETNEPIHFAYVVKTAQDKQTLFTHTGILHAFGNLYLHALSLEVMNEQPRFNWFISAETINNAQPDFQTLRIKPAKLFEKFQNLLINGESSFSYLLVETANELAIKAQKPLTTIPAIGLRATNEPAYIGKHSLPLATDVVDLHIEQLTEKHEEMSLAEMLLLQIQMLEYEISLNIAHNMKRMVVIHGVGNGRLKNAIHEYLATLKEVRSFHNSWMALYGYGATEVFLK